MIELVRSFDRLWNSSATAYHKKDVRQAALRSISVALRETHESEFSDEFMCCIATLNVASRKHADYRRQGLLAVTDRELSRGRGPILGMALYRDTSRNTVFA